MPRSGLADQGRSGRILAFLGPVSQRSVTMLRVLSAALAVSSVAALQPPLASKAAAAKANPAAVDLYSRATATSAARDVALYGMFGPSEAEKRAEQARIDAEQEALNEKFRKESESDFAFMSVFGVVTCVGGVQRKRGVASTAYRAGRCRSSTSSTSRSRWTPRRSAPAGSTERRARPVASNKEPEGPHRLGGRRRRDLLSGAPSNIETLLEKAAAPCARRH